MQLLYIRIGVWERDIHRLVEFRIIKYRIHKSTGTGWDVCLMSILDMHASIESRRWAASWEWRCAVRYLSGSYQTTEHHPRVTAAYSLASPLILLLLLPLACTNLLYKTWCFSCLFQRLSTLIILSFTSNVSSPDNYPSTQFKKSHKRKNVIKRGENFSNKGWTWKVVY